VDATSDGCAQLQKRFEIQGFPTLKFFPNALADTKAIDYDGERKAANIVSWLEKKTGPAFVTLASEADLNKAKASVTADNDKIIVVGVFSEKEQVVPFEQVAKKDFSRDFYVIVGNKQLAAALGDASKLPFIQVLRSFNLTNPATTTDVQVIGDVNQLEKFIATSSVPVSDVVTYMDNDILNTVKTGVHVVEFYAPWCGYCKQFAPEYEKVARHYLASDKKIVIAKYDGTQNEEVTEKESIDSFPTTKIYKDGVSATFKGDLSKDAVIKFIEEKLTAKAETLANEAAVATFAKEGAVIVGCVTAEHESIVDLLAFQASDIKVGKLRCNADNERLTVYVDGVKKSDYPSTSPISHVAAVRKWYKRATLNPVFRFDDSIFDDVMAAEYRYVVFYFNSQVNGDEPEIKAFQTAASQELFPDTVYSYSSASEEYLLQFFHVKPEELPASRLLDTQGSMTSYQGPSQITVESLKEMFQKLEDGTLEKVVAPAEEVNDEYAEGGENQGEEDAGEADVEGEGEDAEQENEEPEQEEEEQDEL
jgi:protein disulfide-isomerase-like protein